MNSGINVARIRSIGSAYVAEARINQMSKWKGIIAIVAIGNPLFYLIAIGIGVGVLVNQNSGTSGTGGVEYITFIAPALLASAALTGVMDETMFPVMEGFKWRKLFFAMNATPITGGQIAMGVFLAAMLRCIHRNLLLGFVDCIWNRHNFRIVGCGSNNHVCSRRIWGANNGRYSKSEK